MDDADEADVQRGRVNAIGDANNETSTRRNRCAMMMMVSNIALYSGVVIEEVVQADGSWCEEDTGQGCALERREGFESVSNARYSGRQSESVRSGNSGF